MMRCFAAVPVAAVIVTAGGGVVPSARPVTVSVRHAVETGRPIWAFLHDKGPLLTPTDDTVRPILSPRALSRIAARGTAPDPQDDRPVFAPHRAALAGAGMEIAGESRWLNAVAGWVSVDRLADVAALPFVDSLRPVALFRRPRAVTPPPPAVGPSPEPWGLAVFDYGPSHAQIVAIEVDSLHAIGLDGTGVRIGFLDSGFSLDIDAFASLDLRGTRDFIEGDADVGDGDTIQMRHGTGTLSVCGGFAPGHLVGVAPRAEYVLAKTELTLQEIEIEEYNWVAGLEWLDAMGCDIVSSSLGYTLWYVDSDYDGNTAVATIAADRAAARGILVVNAVGNDGCFHPINISVPADGDSVLAVGASDLEGEKVWFSSCGPTYDGRIKPDMLAPGVNVWSAAPAAGEYGYSSGTSFSAPLVSGVAALLLQRDPALTPHQLIDLLRRTAGHARNPANTYGWGVVRAAAALAALDSARNGSLPESGITVWPNPAGSRVTVALPIDDSSEVWHVRVFTMAGELIDSRVVSGAWEMVWPDRRIEARLAAGIYLFHVKSRRHEAIIKVAWMPKG